MKKRTNDQGPILPKPLLFAIQTGGYAVPFLEFSSEMALIGKTGQEGSVGDGKAFIQQGFRLFKTKLDQEGMGRHPYSGREKNE